MTDNFLLLYQDIYTLTPLVFSVLIAIMMVTGKWKRELNTMIFLVVDGICTSMFLYDFIEAAFMMISVSAILVVIYSLFRKRSVCDKKRDTK